MRANKHFSHFQYQPEQHLVQDIHDELIQIMGVDCSYLPKEHFDYDVIMGEDSDIRFKNSFLIEMMLEETDDYIGNSTLSKFGLQIEETVNFILSKRRFDETKIPDRARPHEGDLIFYPVDQRLYQITYVDYQAPGFLQAGIFPNYKLSCELYVPSHEQIQTKVDAVNMTDQEIQRFEVDVYDVEGKFIQFEDVVGSYDGFKATVHKFYPRKKRIELNHLTGLFKKDEVITGLSSGATAKIHLDVNFDLSEHPDDKKLNSNLEFKTERDTLVDWDVNNPLA